LLRESLIFPLSTNFCCAFNAELNDKRKRKIRSLRDAIVLKLNNLRQI
jgi:hypothetical protein